MYLVSFYRFLNMLLLVTLFLSNSIIHLILIYRSNVQYCSDTKARKKMSRTSFG